jgi:hypothetical protein
MPLESFGTSWTMEQMTKRAMELSAENSAMKDLVRVLQDQNAELRRLQGLPFEGTEDATPKRKRKVEP